MSVELEQSLSVEYCKQRKTTLKGSLTRFANSVNKLGDSVNISELKSKLLKQDREMSEFERVITVLINATADPDEQEALYVEGDDYNHTFVTTRAEVLRLLGMAPQEVRAAQTIHGPAQSPVTAAQVQCNPSRLQAIPLPKFNGQLDKWPEFAHLFKSLVIDCTSLSNVEKLMHLKSCLFGEATRSLADISSLESNFDVAWNLLQKQYNNPKLLIEDHVKSLFALPKVFSSDANTIREHLMKFNSHCDVLKAVKGLTIDNLLIQFSLIKLDEITREKWEEFSYKLDEPTFADVIEFLTQRSHIKSAASKGATSTNKPHHKKSPSSLSHVALDGNSRLSKCNFCGDNHRIYDCTSFLKLSAQDRYDTVLAKKLCINCLGNAHQIKQCSSKRTCFKCRKRHNTLLHDVQVSTQPQNNERQQTQQATGISPQAGSSAALTTYFPTVNNQCQILLSTVLIDIENCQGERYTVRALLDNGSQPHVVTENLIKQLGLPFAESHTRIAGIGTAATPVKGTVKLSIFSKYNNYRVQIVATIIDKITQDIPSRSIDYKQFHLPQNIQLADPQFGTPGPIDLIIGADLFFQLLYPGRILNVNGPTFQETEFGWIISGRFPSPYTPNHERTFHLKLVDALDIQLRKFWELENVDALSETQSRDYCETHFSKTVSRDTTGRFVVKLPFNSLKDEIGSSYEMAAKRLTGIETRLRRNPDLKVAYTEFMREYENLGHMTKCDKSAKGYFIPHHAVIRENSLSTKCRCVFDASAKTSTGVSLNDALHVGPVIQDDIITILMRFRTHPIVVTADIEKMYRQIRIADEDKMYQKILWRTSPTDPISTYELNTVTYGTACAPYLATRCLKELALLEQDTNPRAANILLSDFYVDDCITGCASVSEAMNLKRELISVLSSAGLPLQKWRSNVPELMSECAISSLVLNKSTMNTLGLSWDHLQDSLLFLPSSVTHHDAKVTKRIILSDVAKLYDPLGLVGPVVVVAKLLLQKLWKLNCSWDQSVPVDMHAEWVDYRTQLGKIISINIPRCMFPDPYVYAELHGFCDASKYAYGCCIYVRTMNIQSVVCTRLLCAKSRVAPVKIDTECETTLPRLELCGALLLAQLMNKVLKSIKMNFNKSFCWSDSTIVLCWLASSSHNFKTFVSNRVRQIHELTTDSEWRHVRTKQNPADIISRGAHPSDLKDNSLWWYGPDFLKFDNSQWPQLELFQPLYTIENRSDSIVSHIVVEPLNLVTRYSSLVKLVRVTAYCLRFVNNCRSRPRISGVINAEEYNASLYRLIKLEQRKCYSKEIERLSRNQNLSPSSSIITLTPYLDEHKLLRVGGRLRHAEISVNQQHPIILPSHNLLTDLIINYEHLRMLHAGQQAVLASLRTRYWPLSGNSTVRKILRRCIRCCRVRPTAMQYRMGDLPEHRVNPSRPFSSCGIDYCGPFSIVANHRRGVRPSKAYVAVFVCFATKATHLEVVGDLTTEACLNALRRFISRRGIISHLYSDNGTNFIGCNNELKRLARSLSNEEAQAQLATLQIRWHFIPPRSPHFGGLWEAAVKSAKHHLKRVSSQTNLTFEELSTVLAQTEACLNSRPLVPTSDDPNDLGALTPGHFLIGQPLMALPDMNLNDVPQNRLSKWQRVQQMNQQFWIRWSREYLSQLQSRSKWKQQHHPLRVGALVIVREENAPPLRWKLGRVLEVFLGADEVPRVASVKTISGIERVSVKRLCLLPIESTV